MTPPPPPHEVYLDLLARYGPQGWWPTTPARGVRPRYYPDRPGRALRPAERWEVAVGAILTQNTAWRNAEAALVALHRRGLRSPGAVAALPRQELAGLIYPSGYHNQKARHLQELAAWVEGAGGGDLEALLRRPGPELRPALLERRGVGPETADSILLYAAGSPFFVVDAYTRRLGARLGWVDDEGVAYEDLRAFLESCLPRDAVLYNEYHALLVRHAVEHCRKRPACDGCCLLHRCAHGRQRPQEEAT